jgi:hypothetical protein
MAVSIKMVAFWVVAPCSPTTRRYNPEDSHILCLPCVHLIVQNVCAIYVLFFIQHLFCLRTFGPPSIFTHTPTWLGCSVGEWLYREAFTTDDHGQKHMHLNTKPSVSLPQNMSVSYTVVYAVCYSGEKLWPWQYRPMQKSDSSKSVARNWCIPVEKTLCHSSIEFYVQVNST